MGLSCLVAGATLSEVCVATLCTLADPIRGNASAIPSPCKQLEPQTAAVHASHVHPAPNLQKNRASAKWRIARFPKRRRLLYPARRGAANGSTLLSPEKRPLQRHEHDDRLRHKLDVLGRDRKGKPEAFCCVSSLSPHRGTSRPSTWLRGRNKQSKSTADTLSLP